MRHQVPTGNTTLQAIMRRHEFALGVDSIRNGVAPDFDGLADDYWSYERGRLWASVALRFADFVCIGRSKREGVRVPFGELVHRPHTHGLGGLNERRSVCPHERIAAH